MRIQVADTSALTPEQRETRINNVRAYFAHFGLESSLQPEAATGPATAASAPAGLTITMGVQCPHRQDGPAYGDGKAKPACN